MDQAYEILHPEVTAASRDNHKGIRLRRIRPANGYGDQPILIIMEIDAFMAPAFFVVYQIVLF